ncbi:hypothetical protein FNH05_09200 [Amycolatopsis rhizosphaerae]|uniref:Uncharacterized protein n=1 Tax=Amycolatopsis rhizosphaerae TaxID=2053003 RepID=A0A558D402_9PSEU|nr:hypothetical protein [Amycolatopsis rhizosphaerae]TVT55731.1 hypothetical protein FNH05_09200 [Amycolatopsis rhizosphaerae]
MNVLGPPHSEKTIEPLAREFASWLRKSGGNVADAELRRRVLLMVTEGRNGHGWAENEVAAGRRALSCRSLESCGKFRFELVRDGG